MSTPAENTDEINNAELFVFKPTGMLVSTQWLHDNGHSSGGCDSVSTVAPKVRESLRALVASAATAMTETEQAIARVEAIAIELEINRIEASKQAYFCNHGRHVTTAHNRHEPSTQ